MSDAIDIESVKKVVGDELREDFSAPPDALHGRKLYPYTSGRHEHLVSILHNDLVSGKEYKDIVNPSFAVKEFLYIHTLTPEEIEDTADGGDEWKKKVRLFGHDFSVSLVEETSIVTKMFNRARRAIVSVQEKPRDPNAPLESPPPNS